ncbi:MAG: proton-conducting transporter membrane subunit [Elusimicrobiales bacterium]
MNLFLSSLVLLALAGAVSLFSRTVRVAAAATVAACALGLAGIVPALRGNIISISLPLHIPGGRFYLAADSLSALFLVPLFLLGGCAAVYSLGYMQKRRGAAFLLMNLLTAAMAVVFTARNGMLFLIAWELMAVFSFLLVVWDYEDSQSRQAGWIYLVASHLGTACIIALFALAWGKCGSLDFDAFPRAFALLPFGAVAALTLLGFGAKAGFFPLHVWLPKAHPAAPSHISALMSGIMIKAGIYGILRMALMFVPAPQWFGWALVLIGAASGLMGIAFALAQRDVKQCLAYSSVENIGVIALGLGLGFVGVSAGRKDIAFFGFSGGMLHVINHALLKGLLFMGAGAVYHGTGTRDMEKLGGLRRAMPVTAACFMAGSAGIAAFPPLNGFVGELMIYMSAFKALSVADAALAGLAALTALALTGGLAAVCFARMLGVIFLGQPRSAPEKAFHEAPRTMLAPMIVLAALCAVIGICPVLVLPAVFPAAAMFCGAYFGADAVIAGAGIAGCLLGILAAALWIFRNSLLDGRTVSSAPTWGCGYSAPNARMQYTASAFAQPVLSMFALAPHAEPAKELFPKTASFHSRNRDLAKARIYNPLFGLVEDKLSVLRVIQGGSIHAYILYLAVALVALLIWALI